MKHKALLLENINSTAKEALERAGFEVELVERALSEEQLTQKIKDVEVLGIRSKTSITKKILRFVKKLKVIGAFCIGIDQIDIDACRRKGVVVFNAPFSNTRSVAELVIGEIIMLSRNIFEKNKLLHQGVWDKSSHSSFEVRGKKLGIIGFGTIGMQVSILAESLGLEVLFFDTEEKLRVGNAIRCSSLGELLSRSDIISVHIDGRATNTNLIGQVEFDQMKKGALFINLSRGLVVDLKALAESLKQGHLGGAAIDVFPDEPEKNGPYRSALANLPNVILTPHIGGSTIEAQKDIGEFVSKKVIAFLKKGDKSLAVS